MHNRQRVEHISRTGIEHSSAHETGSPRAEAIPSALLMTGRALFGGFFIYSAINHFQNREMLAAYAKSKGVPMPEVAVVGTGAMLLLGGLSLLTVGSPGTELEFAL